MRIFTCGKFFKQPFQMLRRPFKSLSSSSRGVEPIVQVSVLPSQTAHPVVFARQLIQLAICLQQLDATAYGYPELCLGEPVEEAACRFIDLASRYVTSQDLLMSSPEGLETLLLEAAYHVHIENWHTAWLTIRRASGIAHSMGLPGIADEAGHRMKTIWFRLIYSDRFLSLMLGLPFSVTDDTFTRQYILATAAPSEKLERLHALTAGRIITRNLRMQQCRYYNESADIAYDDYGETQDIDDELKQAARSTPGSWWVISDLSNAATDAETMQMTTGLMTQMHQYYLLIFLHLPYLLRGLHALSTINLEYSSGRWVDYPYSKTAALSASREVLSRFLAIRKFHHISSYRSLDGKAFTASIIMLLVHLDGHHLGRANALEHQRSSDLGLVDNVIDTVEKISLQHNDVSSISSMQMLRSLVQIEAAVADGVDYYIRNEDGSVRTEDWNMDYNEHDVELALPYFGTLRIACMRRMSPRSALPVEFARIRQGLPITAETSTSRNRIGCESFAISHLGNSTFAAGNSHLQQAEGTYAELDLDNDPTLLSPVHPDMEDFPKASTWVAGEAYASESTMGEQGCPNLDMNADFGDAIAPESFNLPLRNW